MSLADKYPQEVKMILAKYPPEQKRSAVMPLLYLAQRDGGYVTKEAMEDIASLLEITSTDVASIVGFYTLFHDKKEGKYRMQVCTDLPCALCGADKFLEELCGNLGIKVGETTPDGLVTVEAVMCLAACDKAPMFQLQSADGLEYHENMTVDKTMELIAALKKSGKEVK
jgi:NADH-quinone oxidoreductase subunit E